MAINPADRAMGIAGSGNVGAGNRVSAGNLAGSAGRQGGGGTGFQGGQGGGMSGNAMSGNRVGGNSGNGGLGNSARDGGFGANSSGLGSALGTGFRGPASTFGTANSVVPGSALDRATFNSQNPDVSPMAPYGDAFDFTPAEYTAGIKSLNRANMPDAGMWKLGTLYNELQKPENIAMSETLGGPFLSSRTMAALPSSMPPGALQSALDASLPSYTPTQRIPSSAPFAQSAEAVGLPAATGMMPAMQKAGYVTSYPSQAEVDAWKASLGPMSKPLDITTPTDPISFTKTPQLRALKGALDLAAYQQARPITATETLREQVTGGTTNHPLGLAVDFSLSDPVTGQHIQNYGKMVNGQMLGKAYGGTWGAFDPGAFGQYEAVAQNVYGNLQSAADPKVAEMAKDFRWGGYFSPSGTEMDMMHIDLNGKLGMGGGSFEDGLTPAMRERWAGVESVGMGAQPTRVASAPASGPQSITPIGFTNPPPLPQPRPAAVAPTPAPAAPPPAPAAPPPDSIPSWARTGVKLVGDTLAMATPIGPLNLFSQVMGGPTVGDALGYMANDVVYGKPYTGQPRPDPVYVTNFNNGPRPPASGAAVASNSGAPTPAPSAAPSATPPISSRTPSWANPNLVGGNRNDDRSGNRGGSRGGNQNRATVDQSVMTQPGFVVPPPTIASSEIDAAVDQYMQRFSTNDRDPYSYGLGPQGIFYT